eukprot:TRINITY_DN25298_c0_g1_i3.p1 TRINITY_DN25298_c0_g1~~TRINITY_DN25298_c0_g1_i3.p1  ORF type:complete len:223 (-),score=29.19 TRINITY_DN25298_c0_g1_i3:76-744(-)
MAFIGRRGAAALKPESSRGAIQRALAQNIAGVAIDLQQLCDGSLVVLHEPLLQRVADAWTAACPMPRDSYEELSWERVRCATIGGDPVLLFEEALRYLLQARNDQFYVVELKRTSGAAMVAELSRVLSKLAVPPHRVALSSYGPELCAAIKAALPSHCVLLAFSATSEDGALRAVLEASQLSLDGVSLRADPAAVTAAVTAAARARGLMVRSRCQRIHVHFA